MTTEILYCARCRRVIRPREVSEGKYHFADGEPVCADCFTRLSRRLRPVSGIHEPPKPVDLSGIMDDGPEAAEAKAGRGTPVAPAARPAAAEPVRRSSVRRTSGPSLGARLLVLLAFALAGLLAGSGLYLAMRRTPAPTTGTEAKSAPAAGIKDAAGQGIREFGLIPGRLARLK